MSVTKIKKNVILFIVLTFTTNFFQSTLLETYFFQMQSIFIMVLLCYAFYSLLNSLHKSADNDYYFLLLCLIIPFYSALQAKINFNQPIYFGFLSLRLWFLCFSGIYIYNKIVSHNLSIDVIRKVVLFMSWLSLILFTIYFFINNNNPYESFVSSTGMSDEYRGIRFLFETFFIVYGCIYYFIMYTQNKNIKYFLFSAIFILFVLLIVQRRTDILFLSTTIFIYYFLDSSKNFNVLSFLKLITLSAFFLFIIQISNPDYFSKMGYLFSQMIQVVSGIESSDVSANARIFSTYLVLDYWNVNTASIWLGSGKISNQWNDGFSSMFGYFYPQDIGLLGGIFLYGLIPSIFIFVIPLIKSYKIQQSITLNDPVFILTTKYFLIYKMISSIQGSYYFSPAEYMLIIFILLGYLKLRDNNKLNYG